jgi:hypothetical protein
MNDPVTIEGTVTFLEPGDIRPKRRLPHSDEKIALGCWPKNWLDPSEKGISYDKASAYPEDLANDHDRPKTRHELPDFSVVGVLGGHLWFYGIMPGVNLGSRITISGVPDECGIQVISYSFVNPTPVEQVIMETLAQNGRIYYWDYNSVMTSGHIKSAPTEMAALFNKTCGRTGNKLPAGGKAQK